MKQAMVSKVREMIKGLGLIMSCVLIGGLAGYLVDSSNLLSGKFGYDAVESDMARLTVSDAIVFRKEGDDLSEEEQGYLDWLFKAKKHEVSQGEVYDHLIALGYQVNLIDQLIHIPAEQRTASIQQQLFRGSEHVAIDYDSKIIWCEYQAPEQVLSQAILSIQ